MVKDKRMPLVAVEKIVLPRLKRLDPISCKLMVHDYHNRYKLEVKEANAKPRSMIELVDTYQLEIMALELSIDRDQLDEGKVRSYLEKKCLEKTANIIEQLDVAFQSVKMNMDLEAEARFYDFIGKQQEVIRGHGLQDIQRDDPKKIMKELVALLKPDGFKTLFELKYKADKGKWTFTDFMNHLKQDMIAFERWNPIRKKGAVEKSSVGKSEEKSRFGQKHSRHGKPKDNTGPTEKEKQSDHQSKKPKRTCSGCEKSGHHWRECRTISSDKKKELQEKWGDSKYSKKNDEKMETKEKRKVTFGARKVTLVDHE